MYYGQRTMQDIKTLNKHIQKTYFQMHPNNKNEYRTIYMRFNPFAGKVTPMYSNYVTGNPPIGMEEINPRLLSSIATMQPTKPEFF